MDPAPLKLKGEWAIECCLYECICFSSPKGAKSLARGGIRRQADLSPGYQIVNNPGIIAPRGRNQ
jgi:hypothetical protein